MTAEVPLDSMLAPSNEVVAREIEGEIVIVPLVAGIGDADDELCAFHETGRAIWQQLDGEWMLGQVVANLAQESDAPQADIEADVLDFAAKMARRGIPAVAG